ncbi:aromatic amino acid transaminase [Novosphingobium mangrovi (ex Hu et al. 2023)]|uniref:Aromatic amino acid transaminase n=1 Tax=Novosphingobium mangrovi (ex Hu et al. 2023) TaxID=2930094 RepID=A0ABT0AHY0_9SPHN|nr:aromatic amino acid transaminase [Novosphingobium mangrovi (ex Hu et al. 2023)]MCJ1962760.1 aromatic amino acid transaminase [Novosphingobium mangrovi (ex Hu et al. 2023)]
MLSNLQQQPADALLALIKLHNDDPRADKIDLGVGVYRTGDGETPVFGAIKAAEKKLVETQDSKAYLGPEGDMGFVAALMPYVFGKEDPDMGGRIEGMQTPGGTGSLRLALAMVQRAGAKRIIVGKPSWPNHAQICKDLGLEVVEFNHAGEDGKVDMDALRAAIAAGTEGDAMLLHGCCHNPTGIDYTHANWDEIAGLLAKSPIMPILDLAYQGLGLGMEEDAYGLRAVLAAVPEALICYSCDKNFGLYRDRVGALYAMAKDPADLTKIMSNGHSLARANWSQPPDHGGAAVRLVLEDEALTAQWLAELDEMRERMRWVRDKLAAAGVTGGVDLSPIGIQNGLFSIIPFTPEQVQEMRKGHGIYFAGSGRINVAGLTTGNIDKFIAAVAEVTA